MKVRAERKEKKDKQWRKFTKPKVDYFEKINKTRNYTKIDQEAKIENKLPIPRIKEGVSLQILNRSKV